MSKKNEIVTVKPSLLEKSSDVLDKAKDLISCLEILLEAAKGVKAILDKYKGDESYE